MQINYKRLFYAVAYLRPTVVFAISTPEPYSQISSRGQIEGKYSLAEAQTAVLEAFEHSWNGYTAHAFGADEVNSLNGVKSYSRYIFYILL